MWGDIHGEQYKPYAAADVSVPEWLFSIFLVLLVAATNAYLELKAVMTILDSTPGAVLATAIVRGGLCRNNLLEINMIRTTGAAKVFASVAIMPQMNVSWIGAVVI